MFLYFHFLSLQSDYKKVATCHTAFYNPVAQVIIFSWTLKELGVLVFHIFVSVYSCAALTYVIKAMYSW